jgi:ABC-type uncharacterized transport system permease subunit
MRSAWMHSARHSPPACGSTPGLLVNILALVVMARRAAYPQALMKPYRKGER